MSKKFNQLFHDTHSWKKQVVLQVDITPELAGELIKMNGKNRPSRNSKVKQYAEEMKKGLWRFNGDVIRISVSGLILDGQHRLYAIIESGTTQKFNLQTGLPDAVFDTIDIGATRTPGDTLAVQGYSNYNVMAGATKLIMAYEIGDLAKQARGSLNGKKFTNHDVLNFVEKKADIELLQETTKISNTNYRRFKVFSPSTYAAFTYLFAKKSREEAIQFFDLLSSGENIGKNNHSMIYLLRTKLINMQSSNMNLQTVDKYALLIKAWNAFRKGREIGQLSWQNKEDFPTIS